MEAGMSGEETRHYENTNKKMIIKWDKITHNLLRLIKILSALLQNVLTFLYIVVNNYRI